MHSCIYTGQVRHRRYSPRTHAFQYRLSMMYLDLDELERVFDSSRFWSLERRNLVQFCRRDHLGDPELPLRQCVGRLVEQQIGRPVEGPVRLLTHPRYFGYSFNPVSFYFCFDSSDHQVEAIVAEVNNTPWNEQHCYVLDVTRRAKEKPRWLHEFPKEFHVSPFMQMDMQYRWQFTQPGRRLAVHMENFQDGTLLFDATLGLARREITSSSLRRVLWQVPPLTFKVIAAIYWNALRLWLKGCPVYTHSAKHIPETSAQ